MTKKTKTYSFGSSRKESHDSSDFYKRFDSRAEKNEFMINALTESNTIYIKNSTSMRELPDNSIALVVTSPPYYAGKEYESDTGLDHVPASYAEYLENIEKVLRETFRVLEPGGRICINIANLGRRPYRSLSAEVIQIMEKIGFLLRGEILWIKAKGAGGSCAWGSYRSAVNPVLRDVSERIVVASKNRMDRAISIKEREKQGLPYKNTISKEDFLTYTLDTWYIQPESAKKIKHPAPYPIKLVEKLIELYTFENDIILDPYIGSGTSAIAALNTGRKFIGYEIEEKYVKLALERIEASCKGSNLE